MALALRPDAVFLLSDGEFPEGTVEADRRLNARKVPIHCVDLTGGGPATTPADRPRQRRPVRLPPGQPSRRPPDLSPSPEEQAGSHALDRSQADGTRGFGFGRLAP